MADIISEIQTLHDSDNWKSHAVHECIEILMQSKQASEQELANWIAEYETTFNKAF